MFLRRLRERNPNLIRAAVELHQRGALPANSWVFDLDTIGENARVLAGEAKRLDLVTYVMTKQHSRVPLITKVALRRGIHSTVAVDMQCALLMRRYGIPLGHVGHLNQVPRADVPLAVGFRPEVMTVYSVEQARHINAAAGALGVAQDLLLRPVAPGDIFFTGQEGGFPEADVESAAREIMGLPHVRIAGVTSFPCIRYNLRSEDPVEPTPNFHTILRVADRLRALGVNITQINAPGNTSTQTFTMLKEMGATHVEPGHGLLGTTPNHAFREGLPERPSYCYLTEVSHFVGDEAYVFGGGFWTDIAQPGFVSHALVGHTPEQALANELTSVPKTTIIDYHGSIVPRSACRIGDSVIFAYRAQTQMTRSYVAVVAGIGSGRPELAGLFDHTGTMLDRHFVPLPLEEARARVDAVVARY